MSKRKPKAKQRTYGEVHREQSFIGLWMRFGENPRAGKVNARELIARMNAEDAALKARWNDEVHGPRTVPDDCPRPVVRSLAEAADELGVEGKSDRFIARFINTGRIAANKLSRQRWKFDLDELERVACELEDERIAARKRRSLR